MIEASSLFRQALYTLITFNLVQCTDPPRMAREYQYSIQKSDALAKCHDILTKLDYEIDIYSQKSHILMTKPIRIKRTLRRYDYVVYIHITDRIKVHISAERSIFRRSSESSIGGGGLIEIQPESNMPYNLQNRIFTPIHKALKSEKFNLFEINK